MKPTLIQAVEIMKRINEYPEYETHFEGKGNGEVAWIVEGGVVIKNGRY